MMILSLTPFFYCQQGKVTKRERERQKSHWYWLGKLRQKKNEWNESKNYYLCYGQFAVPCPCVPPVVRITWFRDHVLFAVGASFVWRRKVCSLIVRFLPSRCWHLDIRPGHAQKICKMSSFSRFFVLLSSVISTVVWFESQALYFAISAVPWHEL